MRATLRRYSRNWLVHAIIVAIAILIGVIVAFNARPTRGEIYDQAAGASLRFSTQTGR
ncbi:MAG: hypothetical protein WD894_05655 [Pirellulales bacterium]